MKPSVIKYCLNTKSPRDAMMWIVAPNSNASRRTGAQVVAGMPHVR